MKYKIGYVDEDPTQVKIFKDILEDHGFEVIGYNIVRGMSSDELIEQIYLSEIDLLMIDYYLKTKNVLSFNGDEIERKYSEKMPDFPHVIFTSNEADAFNNVDNPDIIYEKDEVSDSTQVNRFCEKLIKNIERYRNYKKKRKDIIETLLLKGQNEGLTGSEKNELLKNQLDLNNLDRMYESEMPLTVTSNEMLDEISTVRKNAEEFLKSLIQEKNDEN